MSSIRFMYFFMYVIVRKCLSFSTIALKCFWHSYWVVLGHCQIPSEPCYLLFGDINRPRIHHRWDIEPGAIVEGKIVLFRDVLLISFFYI